MELDTFISETLTSLIKGIKTASDYAEQNGAKINPIRFYAKDKNEKVYYGNDNIGKPLTMVEFDIAVSASKSDESGIKGGIKVLSVEFGGKQGVKQGNETVSRIKFEVGMVLPFGDAKEFASTVH